MKLFFKSFGFALKGISASLHTQRNLRIHLFFAFAATGAGFFFGIGRFEWLVVLLCIGFVISAELMNTALEQVVNLLSPGENPLAGRAKDAAAAAVLVAATVAVLCGILIFGRHLWQYLS